MTPGTWMRAAVLAATIACAPPRAHAAPPPDDLPPANAPVPATHDIAQYIQDLARTLHEGATPQRGEAAKRLLEIGTLAARQAITDGLTIGDRRAQLACAEAIAGRWSADPIWIQPLAALLGRDRATTEAAARALARYDTDPAAYVPLVDFVQQRQQPQAYRSAALGAIGQIVQKPVAQALINLVSDTTDSASVRSAAFDALAALSGQASIGHDAAGWNQWWNARVALNPADWRTRVETEQHARLQFTNAQSGQRLAQFKEQVRTLLLDQYEHQPAADKPQVLLSYLNNPDPGIREIGASIAQVAVGAGQPMTGPIHQRLIELIGDAAPPVRLGAAQALAALADPDALNFVLVQLRIEKDPEVKVALIQVIARTPGAGAAPALEQLLNDPSIRIATAAADALRALDPTLQRDPHQALDVSAALIQALRVRTGPPGQPNGAPGTQGLRIALIGAIAPLAPANDPEQMLNLFSELLNPNESAGVRRAALTGLAALGERGAPTLARELDPGTEPDPQVRSAAAHALGEAGSFHLYAGQLDASSRAETDPSVRKAEWDALQHLLPGASAAELIDLGHEFERLHEWEKQVTVLQAAASKPQDPADAAQDEQDIGATYMGHLNQPDLALPHLLKALDYWQKKKANSATVSPLVGQIMKAYLSAHQYENAIQFARGQLGIDVARQEDVAPPLRNAVSGLIAAGGADNFAAARTLIQGALAIDQLDPTYKQAFTELLERIPPSPTTTP